MKVAIVGAGVSGLVCAHELHGRRGGAALTLFEAAPRLGGHAATVDVELAGRRIPVDMGFIVYNERTYPVFSRLLADLGVETRPAEMSFSLRDDATGLEYSGGSLDGLLAQRRNALRPSFWRMVRDILRFFREAPEALERLEPDVSLGEWLDRRGYSREFQRDHLLPMGGAIWSAEPEQMRAFPAVSFMRFFRNHGLLSLSDRPQWRTVVGGSRRYVETLAAPLAPCLRLACPVTGVRRVEGGVAVHSAAGEEVFDEVVLACHSDQALKLLLDADAAEHRVLSSIRYQANEAVLHTDRRLLPRSRRAWASWNVHGTSDGSRNMAVTYYMNRLQGLDAPEELCVTLNATSAIDPERILAREIFHHPVFDADALRAQSLHSRVSGRRRVHFAGAYWGYGFHEDGARSGLEVARSLRGERR
ncbi:MAG: NAD(P)/FAD-dependent oxidoreductase [Myxococcota bacterium]